MSYIALRLPMVVLVLAEAEAVFRNNSFSQEGEQHAFQSASAYHAPQGNLPEHKHLSGVANYGAWSFLMKAILVAEGTWKAVTGEDDSQDKNDRAFSKICLNVSENVHNCIYGLNTAKEIWDKLKSNYGESGLVLQCSILRSLFHSSLDKFGSMSEYIDHIMSLQQRLTSMKNGLDDKFLAVVMLSGLTDEYEPIVMTLESSEATLTSDIVRARLLQHDLHKGSTVHNSNSCATACYSNHRPSHHSNSTHHPNSTHPSSGRSNPSQIVCYNCNKAGHKRPGCPELKRMRKPRGGGKPAKAHVAEEGIEQHGEKEQGNLAFVSTLNLPFQMGADREELA